MAVIALAALAVARPRSGSGGIASGSWLVALGLAAGLLGLALGGARLAAIDSGALAVPPKRDLSVRGVVTATPDRADGEVMVLVSTPRGRVLVTAPEPVPDLPVGSMVAATGTARAPRPWEEGRTERLGAGVIVGARSIERLARRRDGIAGLLDGIRLRAEVALERGTDERSAALLRGFVLGQDDRIDAATVDEFKRSGLAHLLAVSGQNVALLAVLAAVVMAALGVELRARLVWILIAIAIYVPVAGAGPSIQRAGVMGAAGVIAALADRPSSRWYALLLAAVVTLAIDPRATSDVGWQLSFAAVAGILLLGRPITAALGSPAGGLRRALVEGTALTVAATVATAPLTALHFGVVSVVALPANLVALPAVAPVMWLGMLAAAVGQIPWLPVEPLTALAGLMAGYIAQVATWFATPSWAQAAVELSAPQLLAASTVLVSMLVLALRWSGRRRGLRPAGAAALLAVALVIPAAVERSGPTAAPPASGLRLTVLDVGQGDSILVEPGRHAPILVDAGPAAADVVSELDERGIDRLAALAISHPQADHDGGAAALLARLPIGRLLYARARPATLTAARARGVPTARLARGDRLRSGGLRIEVLWPPADRLGADAPPPADPNSLSLVVVLRWRGFEALLTGDAEAEAAPIDPGPVEVLKLAHHGSADAGLGRLLELADPGLAIVSVGRDNPYGHPSPASLATLAEHRTPVVRTDERGSVVIEAGDHGWRLR